MASAAIVIETSLRRSQPFQTGSASGAGTISGNEPGEIAVVSSDGAAVSGFSGKEFNELPASWFEHSHLVSLRRSMQPAPVQCKTFSRAPPAQGCPARRCVQLLLRVRGR